MCKSVKLNDAKEERDQPLKGGYKVDCLIVFIKLKDAFFVLNILCVLSKTHNKELPLSQT